MSVLDLGCGMGDVSLLGARLVGAPGHVTAVDRRATSATGASWNAAVASK